MEIVIKMLHSKFLFRLYLYFQAMILLYLVLIACSARKSNLISTETVTSMPVMTLIPTSTLKKTSFEPTVIASGTNPTITPDMTLTIPPPSLPEGLVRNIKISYLTFKPASQDQEEETKIWVLTPPDQAPRQVFKFDPGVGFDSSISWSNNGSRIAFLQIIKRKYILIILDVGSLEKKAFTLNSLNETDTMISTPPTWSINDEWIALTTMTMGPAPEQFETVLINTEATRIQKLASGSEFISWSKVNPTQYLYLQHENNIPVSEASAEGGVKVLIGQIEQKDPIISIDMEKNSPRRRSWISWKPDSSQAISVSHESNTSTYFYKVNFISGEWELLSSRFEGIGYPSMWSPSGQWFTYRVGEITYLWNVNQGELTTSIPIPHINNFAGPKGWTGDSNYLLFQDGVILYAVDPTKPQYLIPLIDLSALGITGQPQPTMNLWLPASQ